MLQSEIAWRYAGGEASAGEAEATVMETLSTHPGIAA